jgi:hypothetical protein
MGTGAVSGSRQQHKCRTEEEREGGGSTCGRFCNRDGRRRLTGWHISLRANRWTDLESRPSRSRINPSSSVGTGDVFHEVSIGF